ncbi:type VI secretion system tip protein VgrG [Sphingomonas sp. MAH-20]|uniref:Type VI secretion system tip protein VgrG n=1 Tax=Sphingomonas horti TaxID=2682842 RepID=A0A6I4IXK3_9SPHN|nr:MULTISPECIES: type VI secretion system tip protein TssI/VgrG [Sphingomonas]MBA2920544.1 type VI secretion system tip protein VgrG [Sphingomonas sp. CGMCC 1.13658]MVO76796.1 type VI secretion system tip protein VgrG [Sphingomonas horti]
MGPHLLNLLALADATLDDYELLSFKGHEGISEPFDFRLELFTKVEADRSSWIGKLAEWDISPHAGTRRVFAGRIYAVRHFYTDGHLRVFVQVRPAYWAAHYARATHFVQDKTSRQIFEAMSAEVPGLVKSISLSGNPPVRGYSVRYDESEIDYLARLLAQDGIMYFFVHDRGAGPYHHKMIVTNKAADYFDLPSGPITFEPESTSGVFDHISRMQQATARNHDHVSFNVNKLDTPFRKTGSSSENWGAVYGHSYETIGFESVAEADVASRQAATDQRQAQQADRIVGQGSEPSFAAGGRVEIKGDPTQATKRIVITSVTHNARDPWMLQGSEIASYSNEFEAIDARQVYRPPVAQPQRIAPGPLLGVVALDGAAAGEAKIDNQWRIPVEIANARDYSDRGLPKYVWLPVQQQWAHSTHGAQFFPRVGTRVIIDFLYGNPDLPFVSGTVYTPSQPYPFDPTSKATQTGWRSITDKNGSIVQEFRFEDKPGSEEVYLYTGRDYRRVIDQDDWGTVKRDQTLKVERDQKLTVTRDRTLKIDGKQTTDIAKTRTVTITDKSLVESKKEIQLKVGPSTITMTMQGIEIKAPTITIKADATLDMSAGAKATLKAPITQVNADGVLTLKGGMVLIN